MDSDQAGRQRGWYSHEIGVFLALALGITWGAAALRSGLGIAPGGGWSLLIKYGPSIAGVAATAWFAGRAGLADLARRLSPLRTHPGWLLFALLLPVALGGVTLGLRVMAAGPVVSDPGVGLAAAAQLFAGQLALRFFAGGGLGEELGWRGFMQPRVQARVGWLQASLWIGLWHGLWHLPAQGAAVIILTVYTVSAAIIFSWMANRTRGSVFLAALLHASGNATLFSMELIWPALDNDPIVQLVFLLLWLVVAAALVRRYPGG